MIFTVDRESLRQVLRQTLPELETKTTEGLRLIACHGNLWAVAGGAMLKAQASVWDDGQCVLARPVVESLLERTGLENNVTIQVDGYGIHTHNLFFPVIRYCSSALAPDEDPCLCATD